MFDHWLRPPTHSAPHTVKRNKKRTRREARSHLRVERLEARCLLSFRTFDGVGNNLAHPDWGSAGVDEIRKAPVAYADGISAPAVRGPDNPSTRLISNMANDNPPPDVISDRFLSDYAYVWGQFIDHDIDLTQNGTGSQAEPLPIPIPPDDPQFGGGTIPFTRSEYDPNTGTSRSNPRQHPNDITAFIDGSMIYGSDAARADALRSHHGGRLLTLADQHISGREGQNLLPLNTMGLPNANDAGIFPDDQLFVAGDVRANENIELTNIHTLFMREHNRIAGIYQYLHPGWSDDQLYFMARRWVGAEIQAITYNEWLPALLGSNALSPYRGYNLNVNPGIANEFATASFRLGHSMLSGGIDRFDNHGNELPGGHGNLKLQDAFFNPTYLNTSTDPSNTVGDDIDAVAKGNASDLAQEIDLRVIDDVRNFLFVGPPHPFGLDLPAINMQRGRDHGLPDYNTLRAAYGLPRVHSYAEINPDPDVIARLTAAYGQAPDGSDNVGIIDPWLGGLAEQHVAGSSTGPLIRAVLVDQFTRLRDGDRFFYLHDLNPYEIQVVNHTTLADIIRLNTHISNVQNNVFFFKLSISGTVFYDQDGDEVPLPGVQVQLYDDMDNLLDTVTTDANGHYEFTNFNGLALGTYHVREVAPDGYVQNTPDPADITFTRGNINVRGVNFGNALLSGGGGGGGAGGGAGGTGSLPGFFGPSPSGVDQGSPDAVDQALAATSSPSQGNTFVVSSTGAEQVTPLSFARLSVRTPSTVKGFSLVASSLEEEGVNLL
jgi:hypothetical protein